MKRTLAGLAAVGIVVGSMAAWADTSLMLVTPRNIQGSTFRLTSKKARNNSVKFVIRRDIHGIDGPGRRGYLSHPSVDGKGLGTPVKLEERGKVLTFRFSVPEDQVAESVFTLWGQGLRGEGVTYRFHLGEFRKSGEK